MNTRFVRYLAGSPHTNPDEISLDEISLDEISLEDFSSAWQCLAWQGNFSYKVSGVLRSVYLSAYGFWRFHYTRDGTDCKRLFHLRKLLRSAGFFIVAGQPI